MNYEIKNYEKNSNILFVQPNKMRLLNSKYSVKRQPLKAGQLLWLAFPCLFLTSNVITNLLLWYYRSIQRVDCNYTL